MERIGRAAARAPAASAMGRMRLRAPLVVLLSCALGGALLASPAVAAPTAMPPQTMLAQAQSQLQSLIAEADPSAQAALTQAASALGSATASYLWPDASEALPPPTGDLVFTDGVSALGDLGELRRDPTVPGSAVARAVEEIASACGSLAQAALERAGLPADAHDDVHEDQLLYDQAFARLGREISGALARVPRETIAQAAQIFLSSNGRFINRPEALSGPPLTLDGKSELFFYGAEFCPYCAATRWSLAMALSQFGELSPLALSESSPIDFAPSTNTLTFYGSDYFSPLLSFASVEAESNEQCNAGSPGCEPNGFASLQTPDAAEEQVLEQYDPNLQFPFLDLGNAWRVGSVVYPPLLQGLSWEQIVAAAGDRDSTVGQYLDGAAELYSALICTQTGGQPAQICATSVIHQYQQLLSTPTIAVDENEALDGVSCFMRLLCAAVDGAGNVLISQDPTAATPTWARTDIDGSTPIDSIACPSVSMCVAADSDGNVLATHDANAPVPTWSTPTRIDGTNAFDYVRCPSTSLCVAVDAAGHVVQTDDASAPAPTWSLPTDIDGANPLELSCPSTSLCVASDTVGNVLVSDDPSSATPTWSTPQNVDPEGFGDISCPTTSFCIAVDFTGNGFVTHDPGGAMPAWRGPTDIDGQNPLDGVSCASATLCVATDENGNVAISDDADGAAATWADTDISDSDLVDVGCPSSLLCVVVDGDGDILETDDPATLTPVWNPPGKFFH